MIFTVTDFAPASSAFSNSSFTTEAGRSTTSPAAICEATSGGKTRMVMPLFYRIILPCDFNTIFFDLDETLYPSSSGLWLAIRERINAFMHERMGFPPEQIEALREEYFREYGTTLRGLQANYSVDMDEYLAFVHDLPLEAHLHPDPELRGVIEALPARKFIFTNADCAHANRVTGRIWACRDCLTAFWMYTPSRRIASRCPGHSNWP